jgi:hypothetical protein
MSYSRRQLYAMGEPLGDGATRHEVGGKVIYGGGGGGTPETQRQIVDLPEWAKPYAKESLGKAQALSATPYQAYGGERIAQFTPLQQQAFGRAGDQQVAGQVGFGTGLAGLAGISSFGDQGTAASFMSPYMDAVVQQQMESAQRQADIAGTQRGAQAVRAGAFGGSRQAIENAEAARALASQKGQIQATGLQSAFERAQQQFNQEQATRLNAAQTLGQLGQQQFGQQMDITGQQAQFGGQQRQATQDILSAQYQDFLNQQRAPYDQLAFMTSMIRGTPMGQTTTQYQPPPSTTSQLIGLGTAAAGAYGAYKGAAGGEIPSYAVGGIASLSQPEMASAAGGMSDQQLQQTQGLPSITDLAKMTLAAEAQQRAQMRQQAMQQQAMMAPRPQGTVAEEQMAAINAMDQGLGGLDVPDDLVGNEYTAAGGGIVAFQPGGQVDSPDDYGLPSISTSLIPQAAQDLMAQRRRLAMEAAAQERKANENYLAGIKADETALGDIYGEREKRIKAREEGIAGASSKNANLALIRAGLKMAAGTSPNAAKNIGEGAIAGLDAYMSGSERIEKTKDNIDEAAMRLAELRAGGKKENLKATRDAQRDLDRATAQGTKALSGMYGEDAKAIAEAYEKKAARAAQYAAANKPTNEREFVRDWVATARAKGDTRPESELRVEGVKNYPAMLTQAARAGTAADVAQTNLGDKARDNVDKTVSNYSSPAADRLRTLKKKDRDNEKAGVKSTLADDYMQTLYEQEETRLARGAAAPTAPAPAPAPAASGTRPDISSIKNAPQGSTIGAQTSRGWEVKDRSGKVIGYAQ